MKSFILCVLELMQLVLVPQVSRYRRFGTSTRTFATASFMSLQCKPVIQTTFTQKTRVHIPFETK